MSFPGTPKWRSVFPFLSSEFRVVLIVVDLMENANFIDVENAHKMFVALKRKAFTVHATKRHIYIIFVKEAFDTIKKGMSDKEKMIRLLLAIQYVGETEYISERVNWHSKFFKYGNPKGHDLLQMFAKKLGLTLGWVASPVLYCVPKVTCGFKDTISMAITNLKESTNLDTNGFVMLSQQHKY